MRETATQFNKLSLSKKKQLLDAYGHWVWFTDYNEYRISVFEIEGEIVEVWYHVYEKYIWRIRIPTYAELDIHLRAIRIQNSLT